MSSIIKIIVGYFLFIVAVAVLLILISLSLGWFLHWLIPLIDFGFASILAVISIIYGAKFVYYVSGLQSSIGERLETLEALETSDEDESSDVIYVNSALLNRKRARKPRKR